jgi:hypothetical protein
MTPDLTNEPRRTTAAHAAGNGAPPPEAELQRRRALGEQAWAAFQRDWPQLAAEHFGQWVAYHGEQQLGIGPSKTERYQECFRRGLQRGEFQVFGIEHPLPEDLYVDWPIVDRPAGLDGEGR